MTKIPIEKLSSKELGQLAKIDEKLKKKVIGQDDAVIKVAKAIKRSRLGIRDPKKPISSVLFLGKTGVGKSHLAKQLAELIFGSEDNLIRFDMSEYQESHTVSKLIGAPPGYVGYEEGGKLTEQIRKKPYAVVLFDEIEKAHRDIYKLMLQLLDEGHLTDSLGRKVNFKNTIIIMTSNVGVKEAIDFGSAMGFNMGNEEDADVRYKNIINKELKRKFPPEFINRVDDIIIFNSLNKDDLSKIVKLELRKLIQRIDELDYKLVVQKTAIERLTEIGYHPEYGARPLARAIQDNIEDLIADTLIDENPPKGSTLQISFDKKQNKMVLEVK